MAGMELPDIYEVNQARQAAHAIADGDLERAEQLRCHLVSESAVDAGEEAILDEVSRAAFKFRRAIEASDRGDDAEHERLMAEIRASSGKATIEMLVSSGYLHAGMEAGWLPAAAHDWLTRYVKDNEFGSDIQRLLDGIERREDE